MPDLTDLPHVDRKYVESVIDLSLQRLGVEQLDAVQFHWWDYEIPRYTETALELQRLQQAGKIARVSVTNFNTPRLLEMVSAGVHIATHHWQYSLLDERPERYMIDYRKAQGIALLVTVLSPEDGSPSARSTSPNLSPCNRSLLK